MTYNKKSVEDIDVTGKRVFVRCDFNVPIKDGVITDEKRIVGALPTIKYLVENPYIQYTLCNKSSSGYSSNITSQRESILLYHVAISNGLIERIRIGEKCVFYCVTISTVITMILLISMTGAMITGI